ncbi:hypothetical protein XU18_1215 [Perkinsela sp. CCAP 1560/4]|nr:hypothetical protein XU18_1215 [Perkinsela sp. CCAP 1560/4]|eukprot:KNH08207.1 hypothetical protein XU18_1215 [Perkinsela sp. CCAP 1560/4]
MSSRNKVNVYSCTEKKIVATAELPEVFTTPIRNDLVQFVHTNIRKNARQAYAVTRRQGHRTTAESWGTGRAVARIPRVSGGGTNRSGQGAYGNMCRGGHMYAGTKIFRRWHRHINKKQRRLAICSAIAASAVPSLVLSRGHRIEGIPEIPFVVDDSLCDLKKTKDAVALLTLVNAKSDVEKVAASRHVRPTKGKWRNRRYVSRKGPLVVVPSADCNARRAFANIRGVEVASVDSLNLLQLAPGGHLGRFIVWTKSAFEQLNKIYGTYTTESLVKKGWKLPAPLVRNTDMTRLINSTEIQNSLNPKKKALRLPRRRVNPLKNRVVMKRLSPYTLVARHNKLVAEKLCAKSSSNRHKRRRAEVARISAKKVSH